MIRKAALLALLLPGACAGMNPQPPTQPTPELIIKLTERLSAITTDPVTTWQVGDYAVRSACHAYLNGMAARSADLKLASGGVGLGGAGAAGFLAATANPWGAAAAGGMAALVQSFITLFESSGSIPYTTETSMMIEAALNAYEAGVAASPPNSIPQAVSYVDDLWYQCSAGGYAMLISKSIAAGAANVRALVAPLRGRPSLMIEEGPSQMDVVTIPPALPQTTEEIAPKRHRNHQALPKPENSIHSSLDDPDKPARLQWLRETMTYIPALDGPR